MGEAKRKRRLQKWARARETRSPRTWAKGQIIVTANGVECFNWIGTQAEAVALQKRYLDTLNAFGVPVLEDAERTIFAMLDHGRPPQIGQDGLTSADVEAIRDVVLWRVLREHIPDTGFRIEDALADLVLEARFTGDRDLIRRARRGEDVEVEWELQVLPASERATHPFVKTEKAVIMGWEQPGRRAGAGSRQTDRAVDRIGERDGERRRRDAASRTARPRRNLRTAAPLCHSKTGRVLWAAGAGCNSEIESHSISGLV